MKKCKDCNKFIGGNKRREYCDTCARRRQRIGSSIAMKRKPQLDRIESKLDQLLNK